MTPDELNHLRRCVDLAEQALDAGDEPFGSVCSAAHAWVGLGRIVYACSAAQLVAWLTEWGCRLTGARAAGVGGGARWWWWPARPRSRRSGSARCTTACTAVDPPTRSTGAPRHVTGVKPGRHLAGRGWGPAKPSSTGGVTWPS